MLEQESPNIAPTPTLSQPGLLVMDVDSTLIDEEVIDELGAAAGIGEQIASITARAMNGELDFREALQARVALLRDLPTSVFDDVYRRVHFTHGALDLIDALHAHGWKVGVVSGGVASEEERDLLMAMRASCRTLVALGTCATHGGIPAMRNQWTTRETLQTVYAYGSDEQALIPAATAHFLDRVYSVDELVKVDCLVPGCPPAAEAIVAVLLALAAGNAVATTTKSVCETCPTRRGAKGPGTVRRFLDNATAAPQGRVEAMHCLLEQGLLCMGPVTAGGCGGKQTPLCLRAHAP